MEAKRRPIYYRVRSSIAELKASAAIGLLLAGTIQSWGQAASAPGPQQTTVGLPGEPAPIITEPLFLRSGSRDYSRTRGYWPNPLAPYEPVSIPKPNFGNSVRAEGLLKDGKIYLSLKDAVTLALENNFDIAIQRVNLDIADTDLLRTRAGLLPQGTSTSLVSNTLGGTGAAVTSGGGPGGSSVAGTGVGGLAVSTSGAGATPESLACIIHEEGRSEGLLCYKHVV